MGIFAAQRLFLNADRSRAVTADDEDAAFLLAPEGDEIPEEYEGLVTGAGNPRQPAKKASKKGGSKAGSKGEDKAVAKSETKDA